MPRYLRILKLLAALVVALCLLAPASAEAALPADFFGVDAKDVFSGDAAYRDSTLAQQRQTGIGLIVQPFSWAAIETAPGQYNFATYDGYVAALARSGMRVLPILYDPPWFRSSRPASGAQPGAYPPRNYSDMGDFAAVLVRRYGPDGAFWTLHPELPKLPIRSWQIWNEANLRFNWVPNGANPAEYTQLLKATTPAIKAADPGAEVVAGGLPNSIIAGSMSVRDFLAGMYEAGAKGSFDTLSVHPYATEASGVVPQLSEARQVMDSYGDYSARLWATEFGWATGGPGSRFTTDEAGQAARIKEALGAMVQECEHLNLRGAASYDWRDSYTATVDNWAVRAGLLRLDGSEKPGNGAYRDVALSSGGSRCDGGRPPQSCSSTGDRHGGKFVGVVAEELFATGPLARDCILGEQASSGISIARKTFRWSEIERSKGRYDFSRYDAYVAALARHRMRILAVLIDPPSFRSAGPRSAATRGLYPPRRYADMASFARKLVERYGPRGGFWRENKDVPKVPIRSWQIWSEPNAHSNWRSGPSARRYTKLLRVTSRAIKRADRKAEVVTAAFSTVQQRGTIRLDKFLAGMYRAGARGRFDALALNPYASSAKRMLKLTKSVRGLMNRRHDRRAGIWITEFGWATGGPRSRLTTSQHGQAKRVSGALRAFWKQRGKLGIRAVIYYAWKDSPPEGGGADSWRFHTGLFDRTGQPKPGFDAFRSTARRLR